MVPHEVEEAAGNAAGVRRGCVVAFGVANEQQGTESLVVVAESRELRAGDDARQRIEAAVREQVDLVVGFPPDVVLLVPPGAVPKTSSGKIRRAATRDLYEAGTLGRSERLGAGDQLRLGLGAARATVRVRWALFADAAYTTYLALAFALVALVIWPLVVLVPSRRFAQWMERAALRYAVFMSGVPVHAEGLEHLRGSGPLMLASNHTSYVDIPLLRALIPQPFVFLAKREVLGYPLVGRFLRRAGHLTVDRGDAAQGVAAAARVGEALAAGERGAALSRSDLHRRRGPASVQARRLQDRRRARHQCGAHRAARLALGAARRQHLPEAQAG